jgi:hypothetical protein
MAGSAPSGGLALAVRVLGVSLPLLLALERGVQRRERIEILRSAGGGLAADHIPEGGDHDVQAIAEWLTVCGATEILVAIGAVRAHGDVEVAGVGCEVPDLGTGE